MNCYDCGKKTKSENYNNEGTERYCDACWNGGPKVLTEDLGKQLEMAICISLGIEYDGKYKYGMDVPNRLTPRLQKLLAGKTLPNVYHSAKLGDPFDYRNSETKVGLLSAKTSKSNIGKVAPQEVGQATPTNFCLRTGIPYTTPQALKEYLQTHILTILPILEGHTFDVPILYYNRKRDVISWIERKDLLQWKKYEYTWTRPIETWTNSSTLQIKLPSGKNVSILEVQFHTTRSNMAIRWVFENVLEVFNDQFNVESV
jgi:hypothetical protein